MSKPRADAAKRHSARSTSPHRWSGRVTAHSNAMDLEPDVFEQGSASRIAASLKRSAQRSTRRKSEPFRSAMSMLNFYINRAGRHLGTKQRAVLERAKSKLRQLFHRPAEK